MAIRAPDGANNASNASDTSNASKTSTSIEGLVFTKRGQCDEKEKS